MAIYNAQQLTSASVATYFTNVYGGISASAVRDLNSNWISSSALLSGSQTFNGNQIISGNVDISGQFTASLQAGYLYVGNSSGRTEAVATSSIITNINTGSFMLTGSVSGNVLTFTKGDATTFSLTVATGSAIDTGNFATLGSNTFTGSQTIAGTGVLNIQNASGINTFNMSGSAQNNINFRATNNYFQSFGGFNFNNGYTGGGSGSLNFTAVSSSTGFYNTNGVIFGQATVESGPLGAGFVKMNAVSGSLVLAPSGFTSNLIGLTHLSASSNSSNVNIILKSTDIQSDTIISGSQNIFGNPAGNTAGFKRLLTNNNLALNTALLPQVSASMAFPITFSNNTLAGAGGFTLRGPVSSSIWSITNNALNNTSAFQIGTGATTDARQVIAGLNISNNLGSGFLRLQAYKTPLSSSFTYNTNQGAGVIDILLHSSSVSFGGSITYGGTTINNSYFPSTLNATSGIVGFNSDIFVGTSNINFSGSNATFTIPRQLGNSIMIGYNSASLVLNGDNSSMYATAVLGAGLGVTGSNSLIAGNFPNSDYGSTFVGRWNAQDNGRAETAKNVFAVGTGTSDSVRKTGLLIDSGSNTFVEGSLNVSGSTILASVSASLNFADDTAAAAGGVPLGGLYRNGNFVMIRLT